MRRFLIISFDALEYSLVERFNMVGLKQAEYGKIDLSPIFEGGGHDYPLTDQIYPTFLSGLLPNQHNIKSWLSLRNLQEQNFKTIFNFPNSIGINVPVWSYNIMRLKFLQTVEEYCKTAKQNINKLEKELYEYEINLLISMINNSKFPIWRKHLLMVYFLFTDLLGHVYKKDLNKLFGMYCHCEEIVTLLKQKFSHKEKSTYKRDFENISDDYSKRYKYLDEGYKKPPIVLIMSDHGMLNGAHTNYGFYSLNEPLGWQGIKINEFYEKIKKVAYE